MVIEPNWELKDSSYMITAAELAGYSVTLNVITNTTTLHSTPGDGKIWAFLYRKNQLHTSTDPLIASTPRNNILYNGATADAVTAGVSSTITIDNVIPGEYHIVVLFDKRGHNNFKIGNGDLYSLYENQQSPSGSPSVITVNSNLTVGGGGDITANNFTIGSDGAWQ